MTATAQILDRCDPLRCTARRAAARIVSLASVDLPKVRAMLLDLRYTDDGFIADALLTGPDERELTDRDIARQVWRPEQILWIVPPVMARVRTEGLARIPTEQKWTVVRRNGSVLLAEALMGRLRARSGAGPAAHAAALPDRSGWIHARIHFFENEVHWTRGTRLAEVVRPPSSAA